MAENIIKEDHTFAVEESAANYFRNRPVDRRFLCIEYHG